MVLLLLSILAWRFQKGFNTVRDGKVIQSNPISSRLNEVHLQFSTVKLQLILLLHDGVFL